jgi:hypothetical protein
MSDPGLTDEQIQLLMDFANGKIGLEQIEPEDDRRRRMMGGDAVIVKEPDYMAILRARLQAQDNRIAALESLLAALDSKNLLGWRQ